MGLTEAIVLGSLQGLTEFLPVSSSAHLVVAQALLGVDEPGIALEVCVHAGTLAAIAAVLAPELYRVAADGVVGASAWLRGLRGPALADRAPRLPTAVALALGTLPAACAGVLFARTVERAFASPVTAGLLLMVTGGWLLASRLAPPPRTAAVSPASGALIGIAQALALLPGISRSGVTIATGTMLGVRQEEAARFSFLLAVPAIAGAGLWQLLQAETGALPRNAAGGACLAAAAMAAALVGTLSLVFLLRVAARGRLHWFAAYCLPAGTVIVAIGLASG
jgi:undecaprenyl-diphosphatase